MLYLVEKDRRRREFFNNSELRKNIVNSILKSSPSHFLYSSQFAKLTQSDVKLFVGNKAALVPASLLTLSGSVYKRRVFARRFLYKKTFYGRYGSIPRIRNRCILSGRGRSVYKKFNISRIKLRELASHGMLPGVRKASW